MPSHRLRRLTLAVALAAATAFAAEPPEDHWAWKRVTRPLVPAPAGHTLYAASKSFLIKFSEALAHEVTHQGVHVTAVCPGFTDTDLVAGSIENIMKKTGRSREQAIAELAKHNPQGRLISPQEVADAVLWLCGEGAGAITGQAIAVAGGEI